jgi:predicted ester cyclase
MQKETTEMSVEEMSVERNRATCIRYFQEVINGGRFESFDAIFDSDFIGHFPSAPPDHPRGSAAFKEAILVESGAMKDLVITIDDVIAEGDKVAVRLTAAATPVADFAGLSATGRSIKIDEIILFRMCNGRIAEMWSIADRLSALRQLGLI